MAGKPGRSGRRPNSKTGKTQQQLADEAGVSLSTWKTWQSDLDLEGQELADRKKRAEIQRIEVETEKAKRMLAVLDDEYVPRGEVEKALAQIAAVDDMYDAAILSELPSLLAGLTPAKIEKELKSFVDDWKSQRANERSSLWKKVKAFVIKMLRGDLKKVAAKKS